MGALRYGKPLVLDYLSMAIDKDAVVELFDAVLPGLLQLIVSKQILHEEHWSRLIREGDSNPNTNPDPHPHPHPDPDLVAPHPQG